MKFKNGDKVRIHSTTDSELDGEIATVIGRIGATNPLGDFYIIRGSKLLCGWEAILMTEHCLVKQENVSDEVTPTFNLDLLDWERIKKAASESNWIPEEYYQNDWVYDVCMFLKGE